MLEGYKRTTRAKVKRWAASPGLAHRVGALLSDLSRFVEANAGPRGLAVPERGHNALGLLLEDLGPEAAAVLRETLIRHRVRVRAPKP